MESIVILLTGTIKVSNVPKLLLTDTAIRENEYCNSIKKWTSLRYPVIFCENSNYESDKINIAVKDIPPGDFEYLKFNTKVSHLGKGAVEAEIIDYVFHIQNFCISIRSFVKEPQEFCYQSQC
jgi:hypothetical protein